MMRAFLLLIYLSFFQIFESQYVQGDELGIKSTCLYAINQKKIVEKILPHKNGIIDCKISLKGGKLYNNEQKIQIFNRLKVSKFKEIKNQNLIEDVDLKFHYFGLIDFNPKKEKLLKSWEKTNRDNCDSLIQKKGIQYCLFISKEKVDFYIIKKNGILKHCEIKLNYKIDLDAIPRNISCLSEKYYVFLLDSMVYIIDLKKPSNIKKFELDYDFNSQLITDEKPVIYYLKEKFYLFSFNKLFVFNANKLILKKDFDPKFKIKRLYSSNSYLFVTGHQFK